MTAPRVRVCAPCNPATNKRGLQILFPRPDEPVRVRIVSHDVLGVLTHYELAADGYKGRTRPCLGEPACQWCMMGIAARWKGYVVGVNTVNGHVVLVEMTEGAVMSAHSQLMLSGSIRGKTLILKRTGRSRQSAVQATVLPADDRIALPEVIDPLPHLFRLWGLQQDGSFVHAERKRRRTMEEERQEQAVRGIIAAAIPYTPDQEQP